MLLTSCAVRARMKERGIAAVSGCARARAREGAQNATGGPLGPPAPPRLAPPRPADSLLDDDAREEAVALEAHVRRAPLRLLGAALLRARGGEVEAAGRVRRGGGGQRGGRAGGGRGSEGRG